MNIQSSIFATNHHESIISVHQLLVVALALVDELALPGRIAADIDLAIHAAQALLPDRLQACVT